MSKDTVAQVSAVLKHPYGQKLFHFYTDKHLRQGYCFDLGICTVLAGCHPLPVCLGAPWVGGCGAEEMETLLSWTPDGLYLYHFVHNFHVYCVYCSVTVRVKLYLTVSMENI